MVAKEVNEVKSILKDLKGKECKLPPEEKNILQWDVSELKAYINKKTKGMSIVKKFKFAAALDKRIKDEKKRVKTNTST